MEKLRQEEMAKQDEPDRPDAETNTDSVVDDVKKVKIGDDDDDNDNVDQPVDKEDDDEDAKSVGTDDHDVVLDWEEKYDGIDGESEPLWVGVAAGSCLLDPAQPPSAWFMEPARSVSSLCTVSSAVVEEEEDPWRTNILASLREKNRAAGGEQFAAFEEAVERASWTKKTQVRVNPGDQRGKWEQASLELEQCGSKEGAVDFGTISICSERSSAQLAVYTTTRSKRLQPILLRFSGDGEMEEWHTSITAGMNAVHGTTSTPSAGSVLAVTTRGE